MAKQKRNSEKKAQYRVRNWAEYNESLVQRGSITCWIDDEVIENWKPEPAGPRQREDNPSIRTGR